MFIQRFNVKKRKDEKYIFCKQSVIRYISIKFSYGSQKIYNGLISQCGNTGYLTHFPVAQWLRWARKQRSQFACRETEWEIKNVHDVLERGGSRGSNKTSYDVLPWTIRITSGPLLIDKIVEDALKTTDKTFQENIYTWWFL